MATTYRRTATDSDLSGGTPFNKALRDPAQDTTGSDSVTVGAGATVIARAFTPSGEPGASGITGTYTVELEITSGNTNIRVSAQLHRINAAGTVQQSSTTSAEQTGSAGVTTFTFTNLDLGTWAAGNRLRVDYRFRSTASHGNNAVTVSHGGTGNELVAPWTLTTPVTGTAAGTVPALAASGAGVRGVTGTAAASAPGLTGAAAGDAEVVGEAGSALAAADGAVGLLKPIRSRRRRRLRAASRLLRAPTRVPDPVSGTAAAGLPTLAGAAAGTHGVTAAATAALPALTAAAAGAAGDLSPTAADGPVSLLKASRPRARRRRPTPRPQVLARPRVLEAVTGPAAATLSALTADGEGVVGITGSATAALPALAASAAGTHPAGAPTAADGPVGLLKPARRPRVRRRGRPATFLGGPVEVAVGPATGVGTAVLPALTASATGTAPEAETARPPTILTPIRSRVRRPRRRHVAPPVFVGAITDAVTTTGTAAAVLPSLTGTGAGTHTPAGAAGAGAAILPALAGAAIGTSDPPGVAGSAVALLPALVAAGGSAHGVAGAGDANAPALIAVAVGYGLVAGMGAATLPALTGAAASLVNVPGAYGRIGRGAPGGPLTISTPKGTIRVGPPAGEIDTP